MHKVRGLYTAAEPVQAQNIAAATNGYGPVQGGIHQIMQSLPRGLSWGFQ